MEKTSLTTRLDRLMVERQDIIKSRRGINPKVSFYIQKTKELERINKEIELERSKR